nr:MAG TPA: hypothetical protein [Caudoviricetes sp.]
MKHIDKSRRIKNGKTIENTGKIYRDLLADYA